MLRDAIDHLPPNRMAAPPATAFKSVLESCEFSIAGWPRRFMEQEMTAAITFCQMGGGEVDGPERAAASGRTFEYIEDKLCDAIYVFGIHEQRDDKAFDYLVLLFSDGSHLCQCRTLQTLRLFCRHVWAAMMYSPRFRFHVGLLHEHWLTEKARGTPQQDWPDVARPRWVVSNRHAAREVDGAAGEGEGEGVGGCSGRWKSFVGSSQTVQTVLLDLKEKGPTDQDRQVLYADVTKKLGQAASILSDRFSPTVAVALVDQFLTMVNVQAGGVGTTTTGGRGAALFMANPGTVRLPARTSNKRRPGAAERYTRGGSKRAATSGSQL